MKSFSNGQGEQVTRRVASIILAVLFFAFLLPILSRVTTYHDDERFYTDAAVHMVRTGDYLSPRFSDGALRTEKPILTYWLIVASYKLFGVNYTASRLPFLVAGALIVWLTYRLTWFFFRGGNEAFAAAAVMCGNVTLISSSIRSTPDVLLCLFLCTSLYGFSRILMDPDRSTLHYLAAYLGAALAVEAKGFLGLAAVAYAFFVALLFLRRSGAFPRLIHVKVMVLAALVAGSWFVAMALEHGEGALLGFTSDQVGTRFIGSRFSTVLSNLQTYAWGWMRHFFPWSLFVPAGLLLNRKTVVEFVRRNRKPVLFIMGWYAFLLTMFLAGNINRTRYMLPAYPFMASFLGALTVRLASERLSSAVIRYVVLFCCVLTGVGALLSIPMGILIDTRFAVLGVVMAAGAYGLFHFGLKKGKPAPHIGIGLFILLAIAGFEFLVRPVFHVSPAPRMAECILERRPEGVSNAMALFVKDDYAGQIRVLSGGKIDLESRPFGPIPPGIQEHGILVLSDLPKKKLAIEEYDVVPCGWSLQDPEPDDIFEMILHAKKREVFHRLREPYYLAFRRK